MLLPACLLANETLRRLTYLTFFGWNAANGSFTNVAQSSSLEVLERFFNETGRPGILELQNIFFERTQAVGMRGLELRTDYRSRWAVAASNIRAVDPRVVVGFQLGDELVWNGVTWAQLNATSVLVKTTFPHLFIHYDEGGKPLYHSPCMNVNHQVCEYEHVPDAIDYVSTDDYLPFSAHNAARMFYEKFLFPKMRPHQRVWVIPPTFNSSETCPGVGTSIEAIDACLLNQTLSYLRWADADDRVVGIDAFHFGTYGADVGLVGLPRTLECYRTLGQQLVDRKDMKAAGGCVEHDKADRQASLASRPVVANHTYSRTSHVANNHPVGNGELVANVWAENSTIGLLLGRSDVFTSYVQPLKLGRLLLSFAPDPFVAHDATFEQELDVATATVHARVRSGAQTVEVQVWADINSAGAGGDALHISVVAQQPVAVTARIDRWRTHVTYLERGVDARGPCAERFPVWPDSIVSPTQLAAGSVGWYQRNNDSQYVHVLSQQRLTGYARRYPDPLLNRTSGALLVGGPSFGTVNSTAIRSYEGRTHRLSLFAHTAVAASADDWIAALRARAASAPTAAVARPRHEAWWASFWQRSWVSLSAANTSNATARQAARSLSEAYDLTRYLTAVQSRGQLPIHHNGGTVTWGWNGTTHANPDARPWGGGFWFQNTRHMYWYTLNAGDLDLLSPLFGMYMVMLPLLQERSRQWYGHENATSFAETMYFFGAYEPVDYAFPGCSRANATGPEATSPYVRHYWHSGDELCMIMLQAHAHVGDATRAALLLRKTALPWCESMLRFHDAHYPRHANGTLWLRDAQALETWPNCTNPTPQVSALLRICPALLTLPAAQVSAEQRAFFARFCGAGRLPEVPRTAEGLIAPCVGGFPNGTHVNSENVETYAIWPYELYAVNRTTEARWPLEVGRSSFEGVRFGHLNSAWRYDAQDAALLGDAAAALSYVEARVLRQGRTENSSFPGYLASDAADGAPQLESNGIVAVTLQKMLLQTDGRRILLFPAWPRSLDVDAKLHVPAAAAAGAEPATVRVVLSAGELRTVDVSPESRRADVVVLL